MTRMFMLFAALVAVCGWLFDRVTRLDPERGVGMASPSERAMFERKWL